MLILDFMRLVKSKSRLAVQNMATYPWIST